MIEIKILLPERWEEAKRIRLRALQTDPIAFGSSYEEEVRLSEADWKSRMKNAIFAVSKEEDRAVGTITHTFGDKIKGKHVARIFGVYVDPEYRRQGLGRKLMERALEVIRKNKEIVKVQLMVNQEQEVAIKLYKSFGFFVVGIMKKEIKFGGKFYDELIMEKMTP